MAIKIYNSDTVIKRVLYEKFVDNSAPTLVVSVGIHGNEVSGIHAVNNIIEQIEKEKFLLKANFYVISGNLNAISKGIRYENIDLNRLWSDQQINKIKEEDHLNADEKEQKELYKIIKKLLDKHQGIFHFVDLHTTSSPTTPYLTYSDTLNNRKFSKKFPVPSIIGLEEYIQGPLLIYVCEYGHIGIGFEAGQHHDKKAVKINEAFLWMLLVETKVLNKEDVVDYSEKIRFLKAQSDLEDFYEIVDKHSIQENEVFKMNEGFKNFQKISKNQDLAMSNGKVLKSSGKGLIFMPLYQNKGEDGYFIIKKTSKIWLWFSKIIRTNLGDYLIKMIPGVIGVDDLKIQLKLKNKNPGNFTKWSLRLMGYRQKVRKGKSWFYNKNDRNLKPFI